MQWERDTIFVVGDIKSRLDSLNQRIGAAAQKSGRTLPDIKLIAVTKTVPLPLIEQAIDAGITDLGENRVQEALPKIQALKKYPQVTWHMVGHLQRNKVGQALDNFDIIQSLDSEKLAREIEARAGARVIPVLVEVNTSAEATKFGIPVDSAVNFVRILSACQNLKVKGLMTIGTVSDDPEKARPCFKRLRELRDEIKTLNLPNVDLEYLSMGMTDDFEVAIQEGSNMIRIGRALFGQRR